MRFILVTATLPQHTLALVREGFPDISLAMGPGLHRTAAGEEGPSDDPLDAVVIHLYLDGNRDC